MKELVIIFQSNFNSELYAQEFEICKDYKSQKRLNEFKRGRIAAKKALSQLKIIDFPILKSESGAPIWPQGISGSISHSKDLAVAIASKKYKLLGVDLEYLKQERNPEIFKRVCTEKELTWMQNNFEKGIRLFSAKEAIYKAFFSLTKLTWLDVELIETPEGFTCNLTRNINNLPPTFHCQQDKHGDYLLSIVAL